MACFSDPLLDQVLDSTHPLVGAVARSRTSLGGAGRMRRVGQKRRKDRSRNS